MEVGTDAVRTETVERKTTETQIALTVTIDGDRGGAAASLDLAQVAGIQRGSLPFSFRFYANMDQLVTLPADFKPQRVTVEVRPSRSGAAPYRQTYVWVPTSN